MPLNSKTETIIKWLQLRVSAKRLERYFHKVKDKIWSRDRPQLIDALADIAETLEIAYRLYAKLKDELHTGLTFMTYLIRLALKCPLNLNRTRQKAFPLPWSSSSMRRRAEIPLGARQR
jgi:hypothetical protein